MKPALVEDYRNPTYRALARSIMTSPLLKGFRIPLVVALDSSIIHLNHWSKIVFNPHVESSWKSLLERYYETDSYKILNNAVSGDPMLSKYATIHFLKTLFLKSLEKLTNIKGKVRLSGRERQNPVQNLIELLDTQVSQETSRTIASIVKSLEEEAEEIVKDVEAIESFSKVGIPVAKLIENPEEFRIKARNHIIIHLVRFLRKLRTEAPSPKQAVYPTIVGGRPLGVKKLRRWSELSSTLPLDYLDDDLLTYKIASRTVRVSEKYGCMQNYVVYLDKSGSMSYNIEYRPSPFLLEMVPKISFAAASALALSSKLRKAGAKMVLKFFDTEVHDPVEDLAKIVDILVKVKAEGGTNITNVLEDALKYKDDRILIITDGVDRIDEESVKKAKSANLDITCIFIKTDNELLRKNFHYIIIKEAKPDILLKI